MSSNYLFYKSRLVIPNTSTLKEKILAEAHNTPTGGHGNFLKTLKHVYADFFWLHLKKDVKVFVHNCLTCQQNKYQTLVPAGLLQQLPIPQRIWEDISMDFIKGLPSSVGYDTVLVIVDRFNKYAHFLALSHPYTAKTVANIFCKEIVRLHGLPRFILFDRDVIFRSSFWQELFRLSHTQLHMGTSYLPQFDGQTEMVNRCVETYLRCFTHEQPKASFKFLAWAEYSYNIGFHTSANMTPFHIVYGRDPPSLHPFIPGETKIAELE